MNYQELENKLKKATNVNNCEQARALIKSDSLLNDRLFKIEENIIYFYELEHVSLETIEYFESKLNDLINTQENIILILDLSQAKRPSAKVRNKIAQAFPFDKIKMMYVYTGDNFLLKIAAMFVLSFSTNGTYEIVSSRKKAYNYSKKYFLSEKKCKDLCKSSA